MNRYKDIRTRYNTDGIEYRGTVIYPEIPPTIDDIYIITSIGDRYDTLALQFYNDPSLWWIIAMSNNSERGSLVVEPGVQIRIPSNPSSAIQKYVKLNKNR